jgi:hypothetical protein
MAQFVSDTVHERRLGADDDEVDVEGMREPEQSLRVLGADRMAFAEGGDPRASRRGVQLERAGVPGELPCQRVFASARPDKENTHRASLSPAAAVPRHRVSYDGRVDETGFQRWLDRYVEAWRTYDEAAIGDLFSDDAEYRWHPWDAPEDVRGRAAIVAAWLGDRDEPGTWTAEYRPWVVAGDRAVALGVSRYLDADGALDREYHNVFLCRFDDEGRCREFTELFMRREA